VNIHELTRELSDQATKLVPFLIEPDSEGYSLEELYALVHCDLIEVIHLHGPFEGLIMIVDEEGALVPKPRNLIATTIFRISGGDSPIFGNALICRSEDLQ
jgi:hypothetical protein